MGIGVAVAVWLAGGVGADYGAGTGIGATLSNARSGLKFFFLISDSNVF